MTAPDARQSDELRELIAEVLAGQSLKLPPGPGRRETAWSIRLRLADAILPEVTAWHEKVAEAQARARAAEELRKAALEQDRQAGTEAMSLTRSLMQTCHAAVARQLHARANELAADDRTDPA